MILDRQTKWVDKMRLETRDFHNNASEHLLKVENKYYRCLDDLFTQIGLQRWQFMNIRLQHVRRVVTERAREERQRKREETVGTQDEIEEAVAVVDNHDNDLVTIEDLDMEETSMRRRGLLSDEPEDRDQLGHRTEAERSLTPRRRTRHGPASLAEAVERNQRCHRR